MRQNLASVNKALMNDLFENKCSGSFCDNEVDSLSGIKDRCLASSACGEHLAMNAISLVLTKIGSLKRRCKLSMGVTTCL